MLPLPVGVHPEFIDSSQHSEAWARLMKKDRSFSIAKPCWWLSSYPANASSVAEMSRDTNFNRTCLSTRNAGTVVRVRSVAAIPCR